MPSPVYDVCVIGSGAAGGIVTKELCEGGAKVILLEAGAEVPLNKFRSHCWPYELKYRGYRAEKQELFYPPDLKNSFRSESLEPVSVDRIRVLGGRTLHWNAVVLRYAPSDFKERTLNGIEQDWPITYEELAPYYDRIERMIGVCGQDDGLEILPAGPWYMPPPQFRCSEQILKREAAKLGIPVIPVRKALLTKPYDNRPPCHYCGHCMDGCDVSAIYSTPGSMLPKARKTGNLTLRQNALARELLLDNNGKIRAVSIVDRNTRHEEEIRARVFIVCCATVETARLLLNSRSPRFSTGLANSSGVVGRYLSGHIGDSVYLYLRELAGSPPRNIDGCLDHAFIPRYQTKTSEGAFDFQVNFNTFMFPFGAYATKGYGSAFKNKAREMQPGYLMLGGYGKVMAKAENRITVDPSKTDVYGIPIAVLHFAYSDLDKAVYREMRKTVDELCGQLNGQVAKHMSDRPGGFASHEVGTVRMGADSRTSALNSYCQSHDVKNLFVTDGSTFTTSSEKNPTLTIMALSLRAADYIKHQRRLGQL
ncbi:MAG: GMC family oxidoreductase [Acidobacteriota bacterium]|nr:GMC family oxidoreductase [Acidobacteriota bacterium]